MEITLGEIKEAINKNKKHRKKWIKIIATIAAIMVVYSLILGFIIIPYLQSLYELYSDIFEFPIIALFMIAIFAYILNLVSEKITITNNYKASYYINDLLKLIEKYEKVKDITSEDKKKIGYNLLKILKISKNMKLFNESNFYQDKNLSDSNFYKRLANKVNYLIINNKEIDTKTIELIKTYLQDKLFTINQYHSNIINQNKATLSKLEETMQGEDDKIFSRNYFISEKLLNVPSTIYKTLALIIQLFFFTLLFSV